MSDSSTWVSPSTISPSTGTRSPGQHDDEIARAHELDARHLALDAVAQHARALGTQRRERADGGGVCRLARASSHLPRRTSVITTAEASK